MNTQRPVNLKITSLPITAVVSITHRITGLVLFVGTGYLIYLLQLVLSSEEGFASAKQIMSGNIARIGLWLTLVALAYHVIAGVKHLLLDLHVGDTIRAARLGSWVTLIVTFVLAVFAGVWIW